MKRIFMIPFFFISSLGYSECSDLSQDECTYWGQYCQWNEESSVCQEIGGGGSTGGDTGGGDGFGPYGYDTITESQGLRNSPDYADGVLYYPIKAESPYKTIILTPGFGGGSNSMASWAEFYASHGYLALIIGPNDEINDSHYQRGEGLLDGIETVLQENDRADSPVFGLVDTNNFVVSGYSMGGGACHDAAMIDAAMIDAANNIKSIISLNPTVLFEDCDLCPGEAYEGVTYCICLVPQLINHDIPSLIFAGEIEVNELEAYKGMLGQDIYTNLPDGSKKILFESTGGGHGSASSPAGEISEYILDWLDYTLSDNLESCESLLKDPSSTSQYLTSNIVCDDNNNLLGDLNGDDLLNVQDIILLVNVILENGFDANADVNTDGSVNILDVVTLVGLIFNR